MNYLLKQTYFGQFRNIKTISIIISLSIFSSLFSLVIPIAVQILVNYMIFGRMLYPIVFLSTIIFFVFIAYGLVNIFQEWMIEVFQQRMFVDFSLDFSKKLNRFKLSFFLNYNSSELINKFFEITNIQKTLTAILIYGTTLIFQMLMGLALLASYHPAFILYDGLLVFGLYVSIKAFLKPAVNSSIELCQQKHHVGSWLESIQKNFEFFKFSHFDHFFMEKTDELLIHYLQIRNQFFKFSIRQQMGLFFVGALATSTLLLLGGYLVIHDSLSLGQLIASELILGGLMYTLKNLINILDNFYNLVSSVDKVEKIIHPQSSDLEVVKEHHFLDHHCLALEFDYQNQKYKIPENSLQLLVFKHMRQSDEFVNGLFGFKETVLFQFYIDHLSYQLPDLIALRDMSLFINLHDFFVGSIYENLTLNHTHVSHQAVYEMLKDVGLTQKVHVLSKGIHERIYMWDKVFDDFELVCLLMIRLKIVNPRLAVLNHILDGLDDEQIEEVVNDLKTFQQTTILVLSNQSRLIKFFNQMAEL